MSEDSLKLLTSRRGSRFEPGEECFDLDHPERGPFVATGGAGTPIDHTSIAHRQVAEPAWAQLMTWRRPVSEERGEAIRRTAVDHMTLPQARVT